MRDKHLSYVDALKESLKGEPPDEYAARNLRAVQQTIDQIYSPEYQRRVAEIEADPDPVSREAKRVRLQEDNCAALDLEALHRHVRDNNKRLEESGIIPRAINSLEDLPATALLLPEAICPQCSLTNTTWSGKDGGFTYWLCGFCGRSKAERDKR